MILNAKLSKRLWIHKSAKQDESEQKTNTKHFLADGVASPQELDCRVEEQAQWGCSTCSEVENIFFSRTSLEFSMS